ncbi:lipoyl(octanoyl) transferase LipB [Thermaerobacter subterraneus]|uniref:Octanoyltransferase n=1 Tax=Thermaerobacter subterraneus DSM 13965 TaxID=867903 RepID=K6Q2L6_9FIRM|nr:lipoyl(octanoyl) transferase LipB [Thermaerobacter subterraneus]EKP95453.1 lipoate-protein ligase B [Thermaerobacter subterraneus DSM 13965]
MNPPTGPHTGIRTGGIIRTATATGAGGAAGPQRAVPAASAAGPALPDGPPVLRVTWLPGLTPYEPAWRLQERLARARGEGRVPDLFLLLQHPPVYTVGRSGRDDEILLSPTLRRQRGVEVFHIDRGGKVTYHGPGQLVGYGIVDLKNLPGGLKRYVHGLEEALVATLARFGVVAHREDGLVGVWAGREKIAAIGIRVSRGVTWHGFALNVDPDLAYFGGIIPCGITDRGVTSMARLLGRAPALEAVAQVAAEELARVLGRRLEWTGDSGWLEAWGYRPAGQAAGQGAEGAAASPATREGTG